MNGQATTTTGIASSASTVRFENSFGADLSLFMDCCNEEKAYCSGSFEMVFLFIEYRIACCNFFEKSFGELSIKYDIINNIKMMRCR